MYSYFVPLVHTSGPVQTPCVYSTTREISQRKLDNCFVDTNSELEAMCRKNFESVMPTIIHSVCVRILPLDGRLRDVTRNAWRNVVTLEI